jgi:hypothetical protein
MMMRAALILGGLGVLTAMEMAAPPRAGKAVEPQLTLPDAGSSRDTLTRSDRLEVAHLLRATPFQPLSPAVNPSPAAPTSIDAQETAKNTDLRGDAGVAPAAVVLPRPRPRPMAPRLAEAKLAEPRAKEPGPAAPPKQADRRHAATKSAQPARATGPDRPKAVTETGSCANAFAGLLKALSLPTGCDT